MANNYLQFSSQIDKLTKPEIKWLNKVLNFEIGLGSRNSDMKELDALLGLEERSFEYWPEFEWFIDVGKKTLWLYSFESGSPDNAATLTYAMLKKFRPEEVVEFSASFTCDRPGLDEFGGITYVISKNGIHHNSIEGILAGVIRTKKAITIAMGELKIRIYPAKATVSTKPISNILEVRSPTDKKNSKARK